MYGNARRDEQSPPTHFSVHAEFTISHPGADDPRNRPRTSTERDEATGGVRMTYTWQPEWAGRATSEDRTSEGGRGRTGEAWPPSVSNSNKSLYSDTPSSATLTPPRSVPPQIKPPSAVFGTDYTRGYQQGNIFFTSTPPPNKEGDDIKSENIPKDPRLTLMQDAATRGGLIHDSSGYGSDMFSPASLGSSSLPRRIIPPYDRKCRSTCNITLSSNLAGSQVPSSSNSLCNRTHSLRCQTPSSSIGPSLPLNRFYGCGDPWCHHTRQGDEYPFGGGISTVPEECAKGSSRSTSLGPPITQASTKKDASVQTFEMVDKCTSPFLRTNSTDSVEGKTSKKYQRRGFTEPIWRRHSPGGTFTPDSLDSVKPPKKLTRSPKLRRHPAFDHSREASKEKSPADSKASDSQKKPRTVHIDVYCTGTELESDASGEGSDDGTESKTASTPQTVFENEKMRVTHKKADEKDLPFYLKNRLVKNSETNQSLKKSFETATSMEQDESDDDAASTAYPSKLSSYSTIGDFSASLSSVPRSWTTYSMSSCAIPEDYDSVANTSWKDTFSDIDSLLHSRSSIAPTESLDFVPRKLYQTNQSIDETPEYSNERKDLLETPTVLSIQGSDSFEYANSEDRLRIKQMEEKWKNKGYPRPYKPTVNEKTLQAQQKRMQEYMEKKIKDKTKWDSKDSDSNDSDGSGKGWTFVKGPQKRDTIVKKPSKEEVPKITVEDEVPKAKDPVNALPNTVRRAFLKTLDYQPTSHGETISKKRPEPLKKPPSKESIDQGSLSDSSPTSRSPSVISAKQRLSLDPNLRSPFMIVPGIYTEPRSIARKFGKVVNVMKKPGHHVGPAKNPDCLCDHCQSFWESLGYRNRTRSMGDPPSGKYVGNWKEFLENSGSQDRQKGGDVPFTDF